MTREQMISTLTIMGWEPVEDTNPEEFGNYSKFDLAHVPDNRHIYHDGRKLSLGESLWAYHLGNGYVRATWDDFTDKRLSDMYQLVMHHEP